MMYAPRSIPARAHGALAALAALAATIALALPASAGAKVPDDFYGVSAVLPGEDDFSRMGKTGFGSYRFDVNWAGVQQSRNGGYDWSGPDVAARQAATAGMRPTPIFIGTPRFVKRNADGLYPPTRSGEDKKAWKRFVAAAVERYGPNGDFWSQNPGVPELAARRWLVWNEQNASAFWKPKPNPRDYATLVKITDRAISSVDRKADVVLGGMYGYPKNDQAIDAVDFLRRLYAVRGIEKHFDSIGVHPYGSGLGTVRKQIKQARQAARRAGDANVGVFVGEIGWASTGPKDAEEVVGERGQANRLRKGLKLLAKKRGAWNIDAAIVYVWRDFPRKFTACLWCPTAGLLEKNGDAKPALKAVRGTIR